MGIIFREPSVPPLTWGYDKMAPPPSLATIFGLAFEMMPLILLVLGKIQKNNRIRESSKKVLDGVSKHKVYSG